MSELYCTALIPAAGSGKRMNSDIKKQFMLLNDKPVLLHTLATFCDCKSINEIIVILSEDEEEVFNEHILKRLSTSKKITVAIGGKERQDSVFNGLKAVDSKTDVVVIHDGARPFIRQEIIEESIKVAMEESAAVVAVKVKDTMKFVGNDGYIDKTIDRDMLWSIQTPQTFKYDIIMDAYISSQKQNFQGTDDSVIVEEMTNIKVKVVEGDYCNIKITTPEDMIIGEAMVKM